MKPLKVRVPHPKGGMAIGKVIRYDDGKPHYSPFYIVELEGMQASIKVPAHKVEAENHDEITAQFQGIFAEVQQKLQERCFPTKEDV